MIYVKLITTLPKIILNIYFNCFISILTFSSSEIDFGQLSKTMDTFKNPMRLQYFLSVVNLVFSFSLILHPIFFGFIFDSFQQNSSVCLLCSVQNVWTNSRLRLFRTSKQNEHLSTNTLLPLRIHIHWNKKETNVGVSTANSGRLSWETVPRQSPCGQFFGEISLRPYFHVRSRFARSKKVNSNFIVVYVF